MEEIKTQQQPIIEPIKEPTVIEKIDCLKMLSQSLIVDEDTPTFVDFQRNLNLFDEIERGIIKKKILELVNKI